MPEYGRGIQNMVEYALTIQDRAQRQLCARTIVTIMGNMFPHLRDVPDFKHKLWDHLAIMADFKLDIDYPYEITSRASVGSRPAPLAYPMKNIRYRHYGYLLETLLKRLMEMPEGEERDELALLVAGQMKRSLVNWNKDGMDDEKIAQDIAAYTHGTVQLDAERFQEVCMQAERSSGMNRPAAGARGMVRRNKRKN